MDKRKTVHNRKLPPDAEVASLYRSGLSTFEIAERFGVQPPAVQKALKRAGEPTRQLTEASALSKARGRQKPSRYWLGKKQPREAVERRAAKIRGENHYLWKGGGETRPYRKVIQKERCGSCGARLNLCIHHVDLDHQNNAPENLMVLCVSCHLSFHKWLYWQAKKAGQETPKSTGPSHWEAWKKSQP